MGHFQRKKGVLIIHCWNRLKLPHPGFSNKIRTFKYCCWKSEELHSWTGGQPPTTAHPRSWNHINLLTEKSLPPWPSDCQLQINSCNRSFSAPFIYRVNEASRRAVSLSDLWADQAPCRTTLRLSSRALLWQYYPATGGERRSRWSPWLCGVGARWAVEENWPVFIKLMNVWSYTGAPRWAIWALERGHGAMLNEVWNDALCPLQFLHR